MFTLLEEVKMIFWFTINYAWPLHALHCIILDKYIVLSRVLLTGSKDTMLTICRDGNGSIPASHCISIAFFNVADATQCMELYFLLITPWILYCHIHNSLL